MHMPISSSGFGPSNFTFASRPNSAVAWRGKAAPAESDTKLNFSKFSRGGRLPKSDYYDCGGRNYDDDDDEEEVMVTLSNRAGDVLDRFDVPSSSRVEDVMDHLREGLSYSATVGNKMKASASGRRSSFSPFSLSATEVNEHTDARNLNPRISRPMPRESETAFRSRSPSAGGRLPSADPSSRIDFGKVEHVVDGLLDQKLQIVTQAVTQDVSAFLEETLRAERVALMKDMQAMIDALADAHRTVILEVRKSKTEMLEEMGTLQGRLVALSTTLRPEDHFTAGTSQDYRSQFDMPENGNPLGGAVETVRQQILEAALHQLACAEHQPEGEFSEGQHLNISPHSPSNLDRAAAGAASAMSSRSPLLKSASGILSKKLVEDAVQSLAPGTQMDHVDEEPEHAPKHGARAASPTKAASKAKASDRKSVASVASKTATATSPTRRR
jgi:hypothetical protein